MSEVSTAELKHAVKAQHGGTATLVQLVPVAERYDGKPVWQRHGEGKADERLALWCCLSLHRQMQGMQWAAPEMTAPRAMAL